MIAEETINAPLGARDAESPPAPRRKGTLLIVDDEEGPRQSLRVVFKDDYELLIANDGASAIEFAKKNKVDVAVCDIRMVSDVRHRRSSRTPQICGPGHRGGHDYGL